MKLPTLAQWTLAYMQVVFSRYKGVREIVAGALGIGVRTLRTKLVEDAVPARGYEWLPGEGTSARSLFNAVKSLVDANYPETPLDPTNKAMRDGVTLPTLIAAFAVATWEVPQEAPQTSFYENATRLGISAERLRKCFEAAGGVYVQPETGELQCTWAATPQARLLTIVRLLLFDQSRVAPKLVVAVYDDLQRYALLQCLNTLERVTSAAVVTPEEAASLAKLKHHLATITNKPPGTFITKVE